jgi:hypothetical protein
LGASCTETTNYGMASSSIRRRPTRATQSGSEQR